MSESGEVTTEPYDKLVLSPGAPSIRPHFPGLISPESFTFEPFRTPGPSENGFRVERRTLPGCTITPGFKW